MAFSKLSGSDQLSCTELTSAPNSDDFDNTVEGETVTLECSMSYNGSWAPIQDWMWSDGEMINPNNATSDSSLVYDNTVITYIKIHAEYSLL